MLLLNSHPQLLLSIEGQKKLYVVSQSMTLDSLKEMILFDFPEMEVNIDLSKAKNIASPSHSLSQYLLAQEDLGEVILSINDQHYVLPNSNSFLVTKTIEGFLKESQDQKTHPETNWSSYSWLKEATASGVSPSSAGTIAHYYRALSFRLSKKNQHSLEDLEKYQEASSLVFNSPVQNEIFNTIHLLNDAQSELRLYQSTKEFLDDLITRRIRKYIQVVFTVSIAHFMAFYYMIFHVEWLGKPSIKFQQI